MEKLSGLVFDVYDDPTGEILRSVFPTQGSLPDLVKEAYAVTKEVRDKLPDEAFALVLVDGDVEMKKFATVDPGNTALSVEYFLQTGHKLPVEAQKVAAQNLVAACELFDIEPPEELQKVAILDVALASALGARKAGKAGKGKGEGALRGGGGYLGGALAGGALGSLSRNRNVAALTSLGGGIIGYRHFTRKYNKPEKEEEEKGEEEKKGSAEVTVSRDPKVGERQLEKTAGVGSSLGRGFSRGKELLTGSKLRSMRERVKKLPKGVKTMDPDLVHPTWRPSKADIAREATKVRRTQIGTGVGATALAGGAGAYALHRRKKQGMAKEGIGLLGAAAGALVIPSAFSEAKQNLKAVKPAGGQVVTPQQLQQIRMRRMQMGMR